MTLTVQIDDACELLNRLIALEASLDDMMLVWHTFADVAEEHLGKVRASLRAGEPTIYY